MTFEEDVKNIKKLFEILMDMGMAYRMDIEHKEEGFRYTIQFDFHLSEDSEGDSRIYHPQYWVGGMVGLKRRFDTDKLRKLVDIEG